MSCRYRAERAAGGWVVRDTDPAPGQGACVASGLTQRDAESRAKAANAEPLSDSGTAIRRAAMTLEDWAAAHYITILPSGAMIGWSCRGNPYQVERDGGRFRVVDMLPEVRQELDALGVRRPGDPQPAGYQSHEQRREARAVEAMIRAEQTTPPGLTDEEIDDAGAAAYDAAIDGTND